MTPQVAVVNPAMAREWLKQVNPNFNRKLRADVVARYAHDMRTGRWQKNGESIVFDENGRLIDGQHRLNALIEADVVLELVVVRGVQPEAFATIDSSPGRSPGDVLSIKGESRPSLLSTTLSCLWRYEQTRNPFGGRAPTRLELVELLERRPRLRDSVATAAAHSTRLFPTSLVAFCHFVFAKSDRSDEAEATRFVALLATGEGLAASHPVLLLRQRLIESATSARRLDRRALAYLLFRAWNASRRAEKLERLVVPSLRDSVTPKLPVAL